jgi:phosphoribosylglycinamide formyltransferase-1
MLKVGWFSTGRGPGSRAFLELVQGRIESGDLGARIEFVFSNRERGEAEGSDEFFDLVEGHGLPLVTLSSARWRREHGGGSMSRHRDAFHDEVMRRVSAFAPDISVLAGYMVFLSDDMVRRYTAVNLHPALPGGPVGTWQQVIWELIRQRAAETGVMVHLATEDWDEGPLISYCSFPIRGPGFDPLWEGAENASLKDLKAEGEEQPLFKRIRHEGMRRERPLLLETIRALDDGRLRISGGRVLDADGAPSSGTLLNEEVDRHLERETSEGG